MIREPRISSPINENDEPTTWFTAFATNMVPDDDEFHPVGLPSRRLEVTELGSPTNMLNCFGCMYLGEYRAQSTMDKSDLNKLMNFTRSAMARAHPVNISLVIAQKYALIRNKVNANRAPNEAPLPEWNAASILHHLRNHNTDPQFQLWLRASELQETNQIALHASVIRNKFGEEKLDEKQYKLYLDGVKTWMQVMNKKPEKMLFYSNGSYIDTKQPSNGPISISGKYLTNHFNE